MSAPRPSSQERNERRDQQRAEQRAAERQVEARAQQTGDAAELLWLLSNRVDDQVVLYERDAQHPGGECFVGGAGPDYCARTPEVDRLLREGLAIAIPEPQDGRKKPLVFAVAPFAQRPDLPGERVRLGRAVDPELVGADAVEGIEAQQDARPASIPVPAGVETVPEREEAANRK